MKLSTACGMKLSTSSAGSQARNAPLEYSAALPGCAMEWLHVCQRWNAIRCDGLRYFAFSCAHFDLEEQRAAAHAVVSSDTDVGRGGHWS